MVVDEKILWLALHKAFSGRPRRLKKVVESCGRDVGRLVRLAEKEIEALFGDDAHAVKTALSDIQDAADLSRALEAQGIQVVPFTDVRYPRKLAAISDDAPVLYVKGEIRTLDLPAVAIAGSRNASDEGLESAARFGSLAAAMDRVVVTGIAKGVDAAAHRGALARRGKTVAVLAEGILRSRRNGVADAVVSQFYPSHTWQASRAMARNAVVCGLSDALIVVEARAKGGTLDAGNRCRKQGKQLLVFEGSGRGRQAPGNGILVKKGGISFRSAGELGERLTRLSAEDNEPRTPVSGRRPCRRSTRLRPGRTGRLFDFRKVTCPVCSLT